MLEKGQLVYWTKIVPQCEQFEVLPLKVHTVESDYFTGLDTGLTKQTHLFSYKSIGKIIFTTASEATEVLNSIRSEYYKSHSHKQFTNYIESED